MMPGIKTIITIIRFKTGNDKTEAANHNIPKFTFNQPNQMKHTKQNASEFQFSTILKASIIFEAAIHPMRQQLLALLQEERGLSYKAIAATLLLEEELCLQQLSILCGAGLLLRQKDNGDVFYTVDKEKLQQLYACADELMEE